MADNPVIDLDDAADDASTSLEQMAQAARDAAKAFQARWKAQGITPAFLPPERPEPPAATIPQPPPMSARGAAVAAQIAQRLEDAKRQAPVAPFGASFPQAARPAGPGVPAFLHGPRNLGEMMAEAARLRVERDRLPSSAAVNPLTTPPWVERLPQPPKPADMPWVKRVSETQLSPIDAARSRIDRQSRETDIKAEMDRLRPVSPLEAAEKASKSAAAALQSFSEYATAAGKGLQRLAANDTLGAVKTAADSAAGALGKLPTVGPAVEAAMKAAGRAAESFSKTADAFVARGKELAAFNPQLAMAGAQADIRSLFADIREADRLGPGLARLTDANSKLSVEFRELMLPIKQVLVEVLKGVVEDILAAVRFIKDLGEDGVVYLKAAVELLKDIATLDVAGAIRDVNKAQRELVDLAKERKKRREQDDAKGSLKPLTDALNRMGYRGQPPAPDDPVTGGASSRPQNFVPGRVF